MALPQLCCTDIQSYPWGLVLLGGQFFPYARSTSYGILGGFSDVFSFLPCQDEKLYKIHPQQTLLISRWQFSLGLLQVQIK